MSPIIRIALRYLAGFLIAKGWLDATSADALATDPELVAAVQAGAGVVVAALSEWWYSRAKKNGGRT
jgi:hypothetical protein